ncbi:putative nuclease HARBI1 [Topomyia yanbarensis]|uniref:putative nuclease HARBI1 n=1 Tax=Topomyia yanbarensis TaxID=2498891 RepID=UPI00273AE021|nr:putative nuclease HARBI1 [Topomyia yanbarensis]
MDPGKSLFLPFPLVAGFEDYSTDKFRQMKTYLIRREGNDSNFKSLYRFTRENVSYLADTFLGEYTETRGGALNNVQKMKCFLRYVGDPGFQVGVGEDLGVHQTTICKTIWVVARKIAGRAHEWIKFLQNKEEFQKEKTIWRKKYNFSSAIGAIDCTHVAIKRPNEYKDEYVNRKGITTFNVQATCNGAEMFTSVDCRWIGSVHDARIWRNSEIQSILQGNQAGAILLGDEAYPLTLWLMIPYKNTVNEKQKSYNILHTKERVIIERLFGQVKQRFPILQSKIRIKTERIPTMIVACFTLHNVAKYLNDEDFSLAEEELNGPSNDFPEREANDTSNTLLQRGKRRRDAIASFIHG